MKYFANKENLHWAYMCLQRGRPAPDGAPAQAAE